MPTNFPLAALVTIVAMIFSAGVTWGFMASKQKNGEEKQKTSDDKVDEVVKDLKDCVKRLDGYITEFQVMKALSVSHHEDHERRISELEDYIAKKSQPKRR